MSDRVYQDLPDFIAQFAPELQIQVGGFLSRLLTGMGDYYRQKIIESTPHGATGELAASFGETSSIDALGVPTLTMGFSAAYANALAKGRKWSKPYLRTLPGGGTTVSYRRHLGAKDPALRGGLFYPALAGARKRWPDFVAAAAADLVGPEADAS